MSNPSPLIAIVGETGSGKSALAIDIARQCSGEIICADSRTVYKGADTFTAAPSPADRQLVPHHMLGIINPDQTFTAYEFKQQALSLIENIAGRGNVPLLVGGSGLYIDAVLFDFVFSPKADESERARLDKLTTDELANMVMTGEEGRSIDTKNRRHMIRYLETGGTPRQELELRPNTLVIGLTLPRAVLRRRIEQRVELMFRAGLRREIDQIVARYGWDNPLLDGVVAKLFLAYQKGTISMSEIKRQFVKKDLHLAKRQRTWFKRNPHIHWYEDPSRALAHAKTFIGSYQ